MKNFRKQILLLLWISFSVGCAHCGPECEESRKPREAFLNDNCKVTITTRECKNKEEENTQPPRTP